MQTFILRLSILPGCDEIYIQFFVDGCDLGQLISNPPGGESKHFFDDVLPYHGGGDCQREDTVLGERARTSGMNSAILFACGCGQSACSCVLADVVISESTITLQNFRDWRGKSSDLGPVAFYRAQYDAAIADLDRQAADWKPPPVPTPKPAIPPPGKIVSEPEIHPDQEC